MLRNRPHLPALQKTYDESYLTCSKAVYYESQGDEKEAMRCWKSALDQITNSRATRPLPSNAAHLETEKALIDSLRQLELQCKERIDLLEALRLSRTESRPVTDSSSSSGKMLPSSDSSEAEPHERGWIGGGTIPAITYPELSRPVIPSRPSLPTRTSSEFAVIGRGSREPDVDPERPPLPSRPSKSSGLAETSRASTSKSPERHTMRTTLRSSKMGDKSSKSTSKTITKKSTEGPGASKAASLAWTALGFKDKANASALGKAESRESLDMPRQASATAAAQWDSHSRRLVASRDGGVRSPTDQTSSSDQPSIRHSDEYPFPRPSLFSVSAASTALASRETGDRISLDNDPFIRQRTAPPSRPVTRLPAAETTTPHSSSELEVGSLHSVKISTAQIPRRKPLEHQKSPHSRRTTPSRPTTTDDAEHIPSQKRAVRDIKHVSSSSADEGRPRANIKSPRKPRSGKSSNTPTVSRSQSPSLDESTEGEDEDDKLARAWKKRKADILKHLPQGVDEHAAKQILNEIVVRGDEVHWSDVAGLEIAKNALREAVVYPFLRPDLFMGLREPARGMLLFGPPGTGKTMLARAVATESKSTFFSISASSLTSKYLGESEKLVRALFLLAKALAPSIIFVDEIDSLLSQRSGSGEHEATRRIKTEFLIQWSDLQRAAAGRETTERDKERGDASRVLVLAATNLPWAIDEAARRRFVRRQYIPLPEAETRETQLRTLLGQQKHCLTDREIKQLVGLTDGFSGSDITALAKDAAMGPLRSLGDALLHMTMDQIRPIAYTDFLASLTNIRPSVSKAGLEEYEKWAKEFGERGG